MKKQALSRRQFMQLCGGLAVAHTLGWSNTSAANKAKVVIIGGGAAGSIVARYLLKLNPSINVSIIEKNKQYHAAFMSNRLLSGSWELDRLSFNYQGLASKGITVLNEEASGLDAGSNTLLTTAGTKIPFDKLIVATGAEADVTKIEGLSTQIIKASAWTNAVDVQSLFEQVKALKPGGKILISIPQGEINGLLAMYERVSQLAMYLSKHNKKAKILLVDARPQQTLQKLFFKAWQELYPGLIEVQSNSITTKFENTNSIIANGNKITADLVNIIPPQKASKLTDKLGLSDDSGWCPVNVNSFESTKIKNVHIIGDALKGFEGFHKNAHSANSQAKLLAVIINGLLTANKLPAELPPLIDSEYGIIGVDHAVSATRIFRFEGNSWKTVTDELSAMDAPLKQKQREFMYAESWFNNITHEMFS